MWDKSYVISVTVEWEKLFSFMVVQSTLTMVVFALCFAQPYENAA